MSKPTISHHLDLLRQANLVVSIKQGQHIFYSINSTELDELLKWILKVKDKVKGKKK
jgi:DNA-binding transcriptional ArsR family regulator